MTVNDLLDQSTVAYWITLGGGGELPEGVMRCKACGPGAYIRPARVTEDDLNRLAIQFGPALCVCSKCEKEIA